MIFTDTPPPIVTRISPTTVFSISSTTSRSTSTHINTVHTYSSSSRCYTPPVPTEPMEHTKTIISSVTTEDHSHVTIDSTSQSTGSNIIIAGTINTVSILLVVTILVILIVSVLVCRRRGSSNTPSTNGDIQTIGTIY